MAANRSEKWLPLSIFVLVCTTLTGCAAVLDALEEHGAADTATPADGLREALRIGTGRAVSVLGETDGYFKSPDVHIGIPDKLQKPAKALRAIGLDGLVDDFETSLNRAAETAAPLARQVFVDTIREMTFADAVAILRGDAHEATDYLRTNAGPRLTELFRPIVEQQLNSVGATRSFNELLDRIDDVPLIRRPDLDLGGYVTDSALDGLFLRIGKEEEKIREDPVARTTELLRKFFGEDARY